MTIFKLVSFCYVFFNVLTDSTYYRHKGNSEYTKDILISCAILCFLLMSCYWSYLLFKLVR